MSAPTGLAVVGRIAKPHGIRGEFAVNLLTDAPAAILASGRRVFAGTEQGRAIATTAVNGEPCVLTIKSTRPMGNQLLVVFAEITDRTAAERYRSHFLLVPEDELTPPDDGEMFLHDVIGLSAVDVDGAPLGEVTDIYDVPQGYLIEVTTANGPVLVPYVEEIVVDVDAESRRIVIDPPNGLFDS
jgi:16S rRNA processing protein RimM